MKKHFVALLLGFAILGAVGYGILGWLGLAVACLIWSMIFLVFHLIFIYKLSVWLTNPNLNTIPNGIDIWADIFDNLLKQAKNRKKSKQKLANNITRFEQIYQSMPNGLILLDKNGRMEFFNNSAITQLDLKQVDDNKGILKNIIRLPAFHQFLDNDHHDIAITHHDRQLLISKTAINNKILLVIQDVSKSEQLNRTRADFVANVSHELRTPLTVISGFTETLLDNDDLPSEQRQQFLGLMQQENERMLNLIKDLLTLSRLEHQSDDVDREVIDLSALVRQIVQDTENLSQNQHDIIAKIDDNLKIIGVTLDIYNALSNLAFNAVKYTPKQGKITIMLQKNTENSAVFSVTDTGDGIAPEHLPRLTERFYRVDKGRHRQSGGTGLGLAISKHALVKQGSCLKIESEVGKGSKFWTELHLSDETNGIE